MIHTSEFSAAGARMSGVETETSMFEGATSQIIVSPVLTEESRGHRRWGVLGWRRRRQGIMPLRELLFVGGIAIAGCGYSVNREDVIRTKNTKGQPIKTVAVDIFESKEFRRGLEIQLAEALSKRIEAETPFKIAKKQRADTIITGEVKEVRQATIGRTFQTATPRETAATFVIAFQWKDLRTGEVLVDRPNFVQTVDYIRLLNENFYEASQLGLDRLSERIVEQLQTDSW